jgi:hypothetical protein
MVDFLLDHFVRVIVRVFVCRRFCVEHCLFSSSQYTALHVALIDGRLVDDYEG